MKKFFIYSIYTAWVIFCVFAAYISLTDSSYGGEGPEGPQVKITDVPDGYKLVKKESKCKDPVPCEQEQQRIAGLKRENDKLKARIKLLEDENDVLKEAANEKKECPKCSVPKEKIVYRDKFIESQPITKEVIKEVPAKRGISIGGMLAYSQDGLVTSKSETDAYAEDAETYRSVIGGPYITIPIGDRFEIGAFGMFGGINQTFGGKLGFNL